MAKRYVTIWFFVFYVSTVEKGVIMKTKHYIKLFILALIFVPLSASITVIAAKMIGKIVKRNAFY